MKLAANVDMANVQLDQFIHALMWKAGPVLILCGCGGIVLRELLRRIGRRATRAVRESRTDRRTLKTPHCPSCNRPMVKRTARRGSRAGSEFWGCSNYPACSDTRSLDHLASEQFSDLAIGAKRTTKRNAFSERARE
jgi:Topoisomerase DNA binding C4 zinc finger